MLNENDWSKNDCLRKEPDEPDNFLGGQFSRNPKRQVTADHLAISYWKQAEINPMEESNPTVEEPLPPRSQYSERVLQGLVSNQVMEPALEPVIEPDPAMQMESLSSILANSAKQKLVTNSYLHNVIDREELIFDDYYDEEEDGDSSPNTVRAA